MDDVQMAHMEWGQGEPLVLIQGLWDARLIHELARSFQIAVYDNRGMGFSTASEKEFSIPLLARDASGVIRSLCGGKAHVLGWSMGGNIAMELAISKPERVDRMVLNAGSCGASRSVPSSPVIEEPMPSPDLTREMVVKSMFSAEWNDGTRTSTSIVQIEADDPGRGSGAAAGCRRSAGGLPR